MAQTTYTRKDLHRAAMQTKPKGAKLFDWALILDTANHTVLQVRYTADDGTIQAANCAI